MLTLFLLMCCLGERGTSVRCWLDVGTPSETLNHLAADTVLLSRVWWDTCIAWSLSLHVLPVGTVGSYLPLYNSGRYDPWVP